MNKKLTHTDINGNAQMVDVSAKKKTLRIATAYAEVKLPVIVFNTVKKNQIAKGDVLSVAKIAGIQASKKTSELIPLCHNIFISKVDVKLKLNIKNKIVEIKSFASTTEVTGIEMEALTAQSQSSIMLIPRIPPRQPRLTCSKPAQTMTPCPASSRTQAITQWARWVPCRFKLL